MRICNTYGPRMRVDDGRGIPAFVGQALEGRPLTVAGDGSQTRSICYVDDTVRGILAMAFSGHTGPVDTGNPDELSILRLAEWIEEFTGSPSAIEYIHLPVDDLKVRRPDTTRAEQLLDWRPTVASEDGLRRTVARFAAQRRASAAQAVRRRSRSVGPTGAPLSRSDGAPGGLTKGADPGDRGARLRFGADSR